MNSLHAYDSDSEGLSDADAKTEISAVSTKKYDYLGLDDTISSSSDSEATESPSLLPYKRSRMSKDLEYLDVLINSTKQGTLEVGPAQPPENSQDDVVLHSINPSHMTSTKSKHYAKRKPSGFNSRISNLSVPNSSFIEKNIGTKASPDDLMTHPKILNFLYQEVHVKLPKTVKQSSEIHSSCVNTLAWNKREYSHLLLSASMDKTVKIWDMFADKCVFDRTRKAAVVCAYWDLNGSIVISAGYDKKVTLEDATSNKEVRVLSHQDYVSCLRCHPENSNLILSGSLRRVDLWDLREAGSLPAKTYAPFYGKILDVLFLNGEQFICSTDVVARDSADKTLTAWDVGSGAKLSNQMFQERYTCPSLALNPDGTSFIVQTNGSYIAEFSTKYPFKMNKNKRFQNHRVEGFKVGCGFSQDSSYIVSGSSNGRVVFYDSKTCKNIKTIDSGHINSILSVDFHPVLPSTVCASSWSGKVHLLQ